MINQLTDLKIIYSEMRYLFDLFLFKLQIVLDIWLNLKIKMNELYKNFYKVFIVKNLVNEVIGFIF